MDTVINAVVTLTLLFSLTLGVKKTHRYKIGFLIIPILQFFGGAGEAVEGL